ncbi:MAG TPA: hypothetical protein VMG82_40430 [Candidatus Sulfotelmatobacter sp.]|nr:hypothetical protein [Candidatus Sulfotelmatobacter sp.]
MLEPRVYRKLLRLYPAEHRQMFGEEILAVLAEEIEGADRRIIAQARLLVRETAGLLVGAMREHFRILVDVQDGLSVAGGRFAMRNGFRFPKSTIVFMGLILGGVLTAIKKGEDIATSVPHDIGPIAPVHIQPVHSILLGGMPLFFAFFYAAGLIGWAILFAFRRSGVHRLAGISGEQK